MTIDMLNGKPRRKQLSDQLDRFDGIIDALANGLPEAVAAATRDGAKQAIADAVRDLLADPTVLALIRGTAPVPTVVPTTPPMPTPSAWARLKAAVRAAAEKATVWVKKTTAKLAKKMKAVAVGVTATVKPVVTRMTARVRAARTTVEAAARWLDLAWRVKRAVLVGVAVGLLVLLVCQLSHTAASLLAGVGTGVTAAVVHLGVWARRAARRFVGDVTA